MKQIVRRNLLTLLVIWFHVAVVLSYLTGSIICDYLRRHYAHGISSWVASILEAWFGWVTIHRAVLEWTMLRRRGKP